ncbi:TetR/AcrR family transcriptional regulator [Fodinisporobacter ferrooxydans]|uniref:TetR/AcrR family transcriptional regulator n=1 Tax=Fodinisporobacter ferrooxydans TaxID=2901836 RepID=A0ABY4CF35_9BACL|nr:TetR/AcrR family transcriptional regulator [Alicyclobacillaceae bacterium MYW30-H2]
MEKLDKKDIQKIRMMEYFITATVKIMEDEGIQNVTIRKVADIAGYNSATIYNYFQEISHLIFFAAMTFLKKYYDALPKYIKSAANPLEKYILIWECFCKFSFDEPETYHAIFIANLGIQAEDFQDYYTIFPKDIIDIPEELMPMVLESNLSKRGRIALERSVKEGYIKAENAEEINEMATLVWTGMLTLFLNNRRNYTKEQVVRETMKYIRQIVLNVNYFDFRS